VFDAHASSNGATQLKAEVWLDVARSEYIPELQTIIKRLQAGEPVELSTGFLSITEEADGIHKGEAYDKILHPRGADHLAIFLDKTGACSLEDGCGLGVQQKNMQGKEVGAVEPDTTASERGKVLSLIERFTTMLAGGSEVTAPTEVEGTGKEFRTLLRRIKALGVTNVDVANALDCGCQVIAQMERAEILNPPAEKVEALKQFMATKLSGNQEGGR
jgi:hypothetical protein